MPNFLDLNWERTVNATTINTVRIGYNHLFFADCWHHGFRTKYPGQARLCKRSCDSRALRDSEHQSQQIAIAAPRQWQQRNLHEERDLPIRRQSKTYSGQTCDYDWR